MIKKDYIFHLSSNSNQFWVEIGKNIAESFRQIGHNVLIEEDVIPSAKKNIIQIAIGGHEYLHTFLKDKSLIDQVIPHMVLLIGEQPGARWFNDNIPYYQKALECWDISESGTKALVSNSIKARYLGLGLSESYFYKSSIEKNIDVLFMGSSTQTRNKRLAEFGLDYYQLENNINLVQLEYAKTASDKTYLKTDERNKLCASSKVILNYHGHFQPYFEWHRALIAFANNALLISDNVNSSGPIIPGIHFVTGSNTNINQIVEYFLNNEDHRTRITSNCLSFLKSHWTQIELSSRFLDNRLPYDKKINQQQDFNHINRSVVEFIKKGRGKSFVKRFTTDCIEYNSQIKSIDENKIIQKKRLIINNQKAENHLLVDKSYEKYDYNCNDNMPEILISVVVSLYNYSHTIITALDSILVSHSDLSMIEIIVVDDASNDDGLSVCRQWMESAPCRCTLISKKLNTGFIVSRNLGIKIATGQFIAILDADNAYLPGGLERLCSHCISEESDAAYGIIISVNSMGQPDGLLSEQKWDIKRLLYSPYIDAMAIFKRSVLLDLGLYDNDMFKHGWFGWEDYELWLRLAEAEKTVAFLPNFVGLYRRHGSSMINQTNIFMESISGYLSNKYKKLAARYPDLRIQFGVCKKD